MTKNQTSAALTVTSTSGDKKAPSTHRCNCGCGEATSTSKTQYKPGHDARHASAVARRIVDQHLTGSAAEAALDTLGSEKLHHKAAAMVNRLLEKASKKAAPKAPRQTAGSKRAGAVLDALAADPEALTAAGIAAQVAIEEADYAAEAARRAEAKLADEADWAAKEAEFAQVVPAEDVKVGRWTYPSRVVDGKQERNTKRDGSGEWVAL